MLEGSLKGTHTQLSATWDAGGTSQWPLAHSHGEGGWSKLWLEEGLLCALWKAWWRISLWSRSTNTLTTPGSVPTACAYRIVHSTCYAKGVYYVPSLTDQPLKRTDIISYNVCWRQDHLVRTLHPQSRAWVSYVITSTQLWSTESLSGWAHIRRHRFWQLQAETRADGSSSTETAAELHLSDEDSKYWEFFLFDKMTQIKLLWLKQFYDKLDSF